MTECLLLKEVFEDRQQDGPRDPLLTYTLKVNAMVTSELPPLHRR
jgi:hypothetical protein